MLSKKRWYSQASRGFGSYEGSERGARAFMRARLRASPGPWAASRPWKMRWARAPSFFDESGVIPVWGYGHAKLKAWICSHDSETRMSAGVGELGCAIAYPNSAYMQVVGLLWKLEPC